jgi:excinuclease ABC subunit C
MGTRKDKRSRVPIPPHRRRDELGQDPPPAEGMLRDEGPAVIPRAPRDEGGADPVVREDSGPASPAVLVDPEHADPVHPAAAAIPPDWSAALSERLRLLPHQSGVYLFRDSRRRVIYVGKARQLHQRVPSYFRAPVPDDPRLRGLRRRIRLLDWIVTATEVEALILEDSLIKQYAPRYNIRLKDDKRYPYLRITAGHAYPAMVLTRQVASDGARYFGPFTRVKDLRHVVRTLRAVFRLRNCSDRRLARGGRECLQYFIHRCSAPCTARVTAADYAAQVRPLVDLLSGKGDEVLLVLEQRMRAAADELRFEESARLRDEVVVLRELVQEQGLIPPAEAEADVVGLAARGDQACGVFLHVREGKVLGKSSRLLAGTTGTDTAEQLQALLLAALLQAPRVPRRIVTAVPPAEPAVVRSALEHAAGHQVILEVAGRGGLAHLLELAARNAHLLLEEEELRSAQKESRVDRAVYALQEALHLPSPPYRIEGFDISNFQGSHPVASQVVFRDGLAWKGGYRHYRMRHGPAPDDFAMMAEVLARRLRHLREDGGPRPDLVLVDGGPGQVGAAAGALRDAGFADLPLVGLAKREEEIHLPGRPEPLKLPRTSPALQLLQRVRDEAHRFAVEYHRSLRGKSQKRSGLDGIPGIGPARRRELLQRFGSLAALRRAGPEAIAQTPGMGPRLARMVWDAIGGNEIGVQAGHEEGEVR